MTTYAVTCRYYSGETSVRLVDAPSRNSAALTVKVIQHVAKIVNVERVV